MIGLGGGLTEAFRPTFETGLSRDMARSAAHFLDDFWSAAIAENFAIGSSGGAATVIFGGILRMAIRRSRRCIFGTLVIMLSAAIDGRTSAVEIMIITNFGYRILYATIPEGAAYSLTLMSSSYLDAYVYMRSI